MKRNKILLGFGVSFALFFTACQPDTDGPVPDLPGTGIDFVGTWNRDSVLVNDVAPSGLKVRIETEPNFGKYTFNSDKETGIMNLSGSDFAITWSYSSSKNTILISEIDWISQTYSIKELSSTKLILTGYKDTGGGNQNERIIYLTKK